MALDLSYLLVYRHWFHSYSCVWGCVKAPLSTLITLTCLSGYPMAKKPYHLGDQADGQIGT